MKTTSALRFFLVFAAMGACLLSRGFAQTSTLISDPFSGSGGLLNGTTPPSTVGGASWAATGNFTLTGAGTASAVITSTSQSATLDLGLGYLNTPGVYTLKLDVTYPAPTSAAKGGGIVLGFMSSTTPLSGANVSLFYKDLAANNQGANAAAAFRDAGLMGFITGNALGLPNGATPYTLKATLQVTSSWWTMSQSITNKATGVEYPLGNSIYPAPPTNLRYVGIGSYSNTADSPVLDNFLLTYEPLLAPAFFYLGSSQTAGEDWSKLSSWKANPDNTGASPAVLGDVYDYYTNGRTLRSPGTAVPSVFGSGAAGVGAMHQALFDVANGWSGSLTLDGGRIELRGLNATATAAVPHLICEGGSIANAAGNWATPLYAAKCVIKPWSSDTALVPSGSGRTLYLSAGILSGAGNLTLSGPGTVQLSATDAFNYRGTIKVAGSKLDFQGDFACGGRLNIVNGSQVILDQAVTVAGLTVNGTAKAPGTYTYAALNGSHAAIFTAGNANGRIIVAPDAAPPAPVMFGVNIAGLEFGSGIFPPKIQQLDYYQQKGLKLIRVPFTWERLQPTLGQALDPSYLAHLDNTVNWARERGMRVVLDMHNYAHRKVSGTSYVIGTSPVTLAMFQDVWSRIASHYADEPALYGYDIMNEPQGTAAAWPAAAQAAVDAIRTVDLTHYVIVEGEGWAGSQGWPNNNATLDVNDTANRLIYSAHSYWDQNNPGGLSNFSGTYTAGYDQQKAYPSLGVEKVRPFVDWLKAKNAARRAAGLPAVGGLIGEFGVPCSPGSGGDIRWNHTLNRFLQYLELNGISGTYWSGGAFGDSYNIGCEPSAATRMDKPQISVLQQFESSAPPAEIVMDNTDTSGVALTGAWTASSAIAGYYGNNYIHDGNGGKGSRSVRFTPVFPSDGLYEVFVRWTSDPNRSASVPVTVVSAGGTEEVRVNQQLNSGEWISLGRYAFNVGSGSVTVSNTGTTGAVVVDAVKFAAVESVSYTIDTSAVVHVSMVGAWSGNTAVPGYYAHNYVSDGNSGKGTKSITFTPELPVGGNYEVFTRWTSGAAPDTSRAANVPIDILTANGIAELEVNQQYNGGGWVSLGTYPFNAGTGGNLTISNAGTTAYVIADAVKFVLIP